MRSGCVFLFLLQGCMLCVGVGEGVGECMLAGMTCVYMCVHVCIVCIVYIDVFFSGSGGALASIWFTLPRTISTYDAPPPPS